MLRQVMEMMLRTSTRLLVEAVGDKRGWQNSVPADKHYRRERKIVMLNYLNWKLNISNVPHPIRCTDF